MKKILTMILILTLNTACGIFSSNDTQDDKTLDPGVELPGLTFTGFDINGENSSCNVTTPAECEDIFGPQNEFSAQCQNEGGTVGTCGCHSYLCSKKISYVSTLAQPIEPGCDAITAELSNLLAQHLETDSTDTLKSCTVDSDCEVFAIPSFSNTINGVCPSVYNKIYQDRVKKFNEDPAVISSINLYTCPVAEPGCVFIGEEFGCIENKCQVK